MSDTYNRAFETKLLTNKKTASNLLWLAGGCRFMYNQFIDWDKCFWKAYCEDNTRPKPSRLALYQEYVKLKSTPGYEWLKDLPAKIVCQVLNHYLEAKNRYFMGSGRPRYKKRGSCDKFVVDNQQGRLIGNELKITNNIRIRLAESPRYEGKIMSFGISRKGNDWYVSVSYELQSDPRPKCEAPGSAVGVDLGIANQVTLSTGEQYSIRDTTKLERKLKYQQRCLLRTQKNSKKHEKLLRRVQKTQQRLSNQRSDDTHKITTTIAKNHGIVVLEAIDIQSMINAAKWRSLRRSLAKASMGEFRRQLIYKCQKVFMVDRFFPSSQICSKCGHRHKMPLNVRTYVCPECGLVIDRDVNAAINILAQYISGRGTPVVSC